ncbi:hypothetical protein [Ilumatobacter sp.]|uniref:hypothetical protein n=1 Tax=Ilumatobacter sp. TaxID=1967498 RepID=UPI003B528C9D
MKFPTPARARRSSPPETSARRPGRDRPGPRRLAARARYESARRPWIRWTAVALVAVAVGFGVHDRLAALDEARGRWGTTRRVLVARGDHEPGDRAAVDAVDLPSVAVPAAALSPSARPGHLRRAVSDGEILVADDLASGAGPAAGAPPGSVVVPLGDPLVAAVEVGTTVDVYGEGLALATGGLVVRVVDEVVYVAVDPADAPLVAAAASARSASLAFPR